ncbi:ribonuclease H [Senna tora]|uniref:Ribonuclease H n=1 Tax=Senna tora TaxID=362788 RepID=A0A834SZ65_9FABA|nr:ribonuclease H [Senna tora]
MFDDDLLFFGEASISQAKCILKCLNLFCSFTGFTRSQDLGRYLGANIVHGRATNKKFSHIVKKVQDKLAGWKENCLSMAEEFFPSKGLRQGDPLSPYIIVICFTRSQDLGRYLGANIVHGRATNKKFSHIVKKVQDKLAGWKENCLSMAGRATLVQSVVSTMSYYHMQYTSIPKGIINEIERRERALLWGSTAEKKRLHQVIKLPFQEIWMGNGTRIKFWEDIWNHNDTSLDRLVLEDTIMPNQHGYVKDFINADSQWDVNLICNILPQEAIWKIVEIQPPNSDLWPNMPLWRPDTDGRFSIKSAYMALKNFPVMIICLYGTEYGKVKFHKEVNTYCGGLPMKVFPQDLERLGGVILVLYARVAITSENQILIWLGIVIKQPKSGDALLIERIDPFSSIFPSKSGSLGTLPEHPERLILDYANAWVKESQSTFGQKLIVKAWSKLKEGWVKVNSDGAVYKATSLSGCGGLIRNQNGDWIKGYKKKIGVSTPFGAEIWGIYYGLDLAWQLNYRKVTIESDSYMAIKCLNEEPTPDLSAHPIMEKVFELINRDWDTVFSYIPRNHNKCADMLAKDSLSCNRNIEILDLPPLSLRPLIQEDVVGLVPLSDLGG